MRRAGRTAVRRAWGGLRRVAALALLLGAGCRSSVEASQPSREAPPPPLTAAQEEALVLVDACVRYGTALRTLMAASANALGGELPPPPSVGSALEARRIELQSLPRASRACGLCRGLASCGEPAGLEGGATARLLLASAIALEGGTPDEASLPAEGGPTVGQLAAHWCGCCVRLEPGPSPDAATLAAMEQSCGSIARLLGRGGDRTDPAGACDRWTSCLADVGALRYPLTPAGGLEPNDPDAAQLSALVVQLRAGLSGGAADEQPWPAARPGSPRLGGAVLAACGAAPSCR